MPNFHTPQRPLMQFIGGRCVVRGVSGKLCAMNPFFSSRNRWAGALMTLGLSALLAGCNGGNGGPQTQATPTPISTPTSGPSVTPSPMATLTPSPTSTVTPRPTFTPMPRPTPAANEGFIAYNRNAQRDQFGGELWVMRPDGSGQKRVPTSLPSVYQPSISRDGRRIIFGRGNIGVISSRGGGERQIRVKPAETVKQPDFSPNGRLIVYSNNFFSGRIVLIDNDGTNRRVLTPPRQGLQDNPRFSPDGQRIFYRTERRNSGGYLTIYSMNLDGSDDKRVLFGEDTAFVGEFSIHPEGKRIVYRRNGDIEFGGSGEVVVLDMDGTNRKVLHPSAESPVWSPDGRKIAFTSGTSQTRGADIYVINADGTGLKNITNTPDVDETFPSWSRFR